MPPNFTKPFAERLDQLSHLHVKEAEEGESVKPGIVYVAPGRGHMRIKEEVLRLMFRFQRKKKNLYTGQVWIF